MSTRHCLRGGAALLLAALSACGGDNGPGVDLDPQLVAQGKEIFRFDTFGDEVFWTDTLGLHRVIQSGVSPATALGVGLKVDASALPAGILASADLNDPATTVALLKLNAVVGVQGVVETVNGKDSLMSVGITCALCHSTVDNSVAPGIGQRLDGWPNRDLNVGAIVALSPALQDPATQAVLTSWGPGMYDAYWTHDGQNHPTVIPPAYGLHEVALETFTGEGPVSYWNAYVAVTQMHGHGNFDDPRLGIHIEQSPDMVTSKLPALREYQHSIAAPPPPAGSFDDAAATRGKALFIGQARCSECHNGNALTDAGKRLHQPSEVGTDPTLAERATTGLYRTTPLHAVWQHPPYFHDGSAATLDDVVKHYDDHFRLGLTPDQRRDLVEYLKSL
jgi:mono/diheme cytochrome c family protein/cytochrome c5